MQLLTTTVMGLESVVRHELQALGYESRILDVGRVAFDGEEEAICQANLWLRTAGRVLIVMDRFEAKDFGVLFDRVRALPWERWIPADGAFPVSGRSVKSQLSSVPACQRAVKKAIVERLLQAHRVQTLAESGATLPIEIAIHKDEAVVSIDTSGTGLHKRGYRKLVGEAPLRETLAAAMVLLSRWSPERPLVDPFCGTGTIPIEAALIGRNLAPGLRRTFVAETWPTFPKRLWEEARLLAQDLARPSLPERISGTDINADALSLARYHARQAGVDSDIHFQQRPFEELSSKREYGCVITNPPYGLRLGEWDEVRALYATIPLVLRRLPTWSHYILTAYPDFEQLVGQTADRRRKLFNSRIECTFYQFHGPRRPRERGGSETIVASEQETGEADASHDVAAVPEQVATARAVPARSEVRPTAGPAFGGISSKARQQAEIFANRLRKTARHLRRWPTKHGITCYRLYDRDIPEIPLVVDRYESCLHMAEYERPHERTVAEHADWLDLMAKTAADVLEVAPKDVYFKRRARQRGLNQYERQDDERRILVVSEGGLRFEVNLSDYLDTGLFLDHRVTRGMVRDEAPGRRFLNLFGYTGSFTVYAAAGSAAATTTVDLSATYLDWAGRNIELNQLSGPQHQRVRSDAMTFLRRLPRAAHFDLAVVDPPTFSNSKSTEDDWDVARCHADLLGELFLRMSEGGVVYFSTNFRRFQLDEAALRARAPGKLSVREISHRTVPPDFRNRRIHRCWRLVVNSAHATSDAG